MLKILNVRVYDFSSVTDDLMGLSFIRLWNPKYDEPLKL